MSCGEIKAQKNCQWCASSTCAPPFPLAPSLHQLVVASTRGMLRTELLALSRALSKNHPIPPKIETRLIPKPTHSIAELVDFSFPETGAATTLDASTFFTSCSVSDNHAEIDLDLDEMALVRLLTSIPIPSSGKLFEIGRLCANLNEQAERTSSRLRCPPRQFAKHERRSSAALDSDLLVQGV